MAEETHRKLNDVEHCLARPDMFIGSVVPQETFYDAFVESGTDDVASTATQAAAGFSVEKRSAIVPPALSQLFLEISTNASDHAARPGTNVKNIRVTMNETTGEIIVWNDGQSIPVRKHRQLTDKYLTTVIFSEFRCGSNFDDEQKRTGAGRNGLGAKCTMVWSKRATVEHNDGEYHFMQSWHNNLSQVDAPIVRKSKRKSTFTKVAFLLDYARLGVTDVASAIGYLRSFVWHLGVVTDPKVSVYLDDKKLPVRGLKDYARIMSPDAAAVVYDEGKNIQIAVCPARAGASSWSVGFVNGIPCHAGTHVNFALNRVRDIINGGKGAKPCSLATLKAQLMIFVNITCFNPTFTSQTKEQLSTDMRSSGASWEPSVAFQRNLKKSTVADAVRLDQELRDTHKAKLSARSGSSGRTRFVEVQDYEPANNAGKASRREPTTLILTEGLSAKGFAVAGLPNRENYGIFPLRGKLRNVRGESMSTILRTVEIANLLKILGVDLTSKQPYTDTSKLRYDRVMLCTDQDVDGAHITGLVLNALFVVLPELMRSDSKFVQRLATPLVKAWPKRGPAGPVKEFLTETEFDAWYGALPTAERGAYEVKYFKGLGTSTARDAKLVFGHLERYLVSIDCTRDEETLVDFFDSKRVEQRRQYLRDHAGTAIDYHQSSISLSNYLLGEVLPFSRYDNERSIAHCVDGLKPAQRKILWVMRTTYGELRTPNVKVAQLSGEVAKKTHYKHGEESLNGTTIRMAQDFPTCGNNLNLFTPEGMYGNRHGDEAASPRYIFTCAEPIAEYVFPDADFPVLEHQQSEGHAIEPRFMVPVVPLVLCNGSSGVGTGWSSDVASYNPKEIIAWCRAYNAALSDSSPPPLLDIVPWLEGFRGKVSTDGDRVVLEGRLEQVNEHTIRVYDLPMATHLFLFSDKKKGDAKFKEAYPHRVTIRSTDTDVDISMVFDAPVTDKLMKMLVARSSTAITRNNMHLWRSGLTAPHRFETVHAIAVEHARVRLETYEKRRNYQMEQLSMYIQRITDEYRFVTKVIASPTFLFQRSKDEVTQELDADGFHRIDNSFDHLLKLPFMSATAELLKRLQADRVRAEADLSTLRGTTAHQMWERELEQLGTAYDEHLEARRQRREAPMGQTASTISAPRRRPGGKNIKGVSKRAKMG